MGMSWADLRFSIARARGLLRRTATSLRTRGPGPTLERIRDHLRAPPRAPSVDLYFPAAAPFAPFALSTSDSPRASIVVPVFNQFDYTLACLRALAAHPPSTPHEVIVVDDGSSDATAASLVQVDGLRFHRRTSNGGFIAACNDGASLARGDVLVFLNNDTVPQPGWLEALLETFVTRPRTGLAGSQLVYPDGRLQESGGLVFDDGSAWNYGRFGDPSDPRYAYARRTDYCSGAAIAIGHALFDALGGFDTRYAPAYYEDTDLAFSVRSKGLDVRVQPASRVVHCEGATSGTDPSQGAKAYQVANRSKFLDKWHHALRAQPAPGGDPDAAARPAGPTILIVDALTPDATRDSGSLRLIGLMRLLIAEGAHVVFLPANRMDAGAATARLQALGIECWHAPHAPRFPAWLRRHGARFDAVVLCRHYVAREFLPLVRRHAPQARVLFDTVDLHYLRERRAAELSGDPAALRAAARTRRLELDVIERSDVTLLVSEAERAVLAEDAPNAQVEIVSNIHEVAGAGLPFAQRRDLVFVGGFRHPPNVDAVLWFVREVWPRIRACRADVVFHCIGADAPPEIMALATVNGVRLHGHVPDLAPYMDGMRIAVAPLRYGAGVKGKVNLSMAHGQPVVATRCAVEGMHLVDGEDVLVADDADAFADGVLRLDADEALWTRLATNGLDNVRRHFSADAARDAVRRALGDVLP
ncbi:glycosyl transferase family protein [Lysobacter xinjiangensis]|uniref:Glycosyl transferase family protein n=1 Tax=Cognatilysobacter xinjiangensis TaxID=546892 RepID=A0ABQ3BNJ2_9GAMM|nr:glycosyltransferase [Lysobacter xinjiangensis]GGZ51801.1 glycosyl transferase family protein [Lysobacter xinjiangensis]